MTRILGTETEFGVAVKNSAMPDPVSNAIFIVNSHPAQEPVLWDYSNENPLLDARGYEIEGERERPGPEYNRLLNKPLNNGGRLYVDGAHPEYATPECSDARMLVQYEKAGEQIIAQALHQANLRLQPQEGFSIYKNNTDGKGNSYGYHENYWVSRHVPFDTLIAQMTPFLITRQIFAGAGKVGAENRTDPARYQISQRADFFETWVDLNTMMKRPIINTRDEPHCDARGRRFHVIVGDANMSEVSTYLKTGTTALVLDMIEAGVFVKGVEIDNPIQEIKQISRDLTLRQTVRLSSGARWRALDIQRAYLEAAQTHYSRETDPQTHEMLSRWQDVLEILADDPMRLSDALDWVIKKRFIESYMERKGCSWQDPRVAMLDLQYHDMDPDKGLYFVIQRRGQVKRLISDEEVHRAQSLPPESTRAYFRGHCLSQFAKQVHMVSWTSVVFRCDTGMKRVPLMDPLRGTRALVGPVLEQSSTVEALLGHIGAPVSTASG